MMNLSLKRLFFYLPLFNLAKLSAMNNKLTNNICMFGSVHCNKAIL